MTGDESWILYENTTRSLLNCTSIRAASNGEARSLLLVGFKRDAILRVAATVTASTYTYQLENLVKISRENRSGRVNADLLHINVRSHLAKETQNKLETLGWGTVLHPSYFSSHSLMTSIFVSIYN